MSAVIHSHGTFETSLLSLALAAAAAAAMGIGKGSAYKAGRSNKTLTGCVEKKTAG